MTTIAMLLQVGKLMCVWLCVPALMLLCVMGYSLYYGQIENQKATLNAQTKIVEGQKRRIGQMSSTVNNLVKDLKELKLKQVEQVLKKYTGKREG